jgi:alkylhydroperoxidase family enzyme
MTAFSYDNSPYAIRPDLKAAYQQYWQALAKPGNWWTGAERVAIAAEVRNAPGCDYCAQRKQALSPYNFPGEHKHDGVLDPLAVDAVHRIVTDQTRITQAWVTDVAGRGLGDGKYVELLGIVVTVFSIDEFNRALGLAYEPLPAPEPGEPDHYRPSQAQHETGFVAMLPADGATGAESDLWPNGKTANVLRALSLVPDAVRGWMHVAGAQYLSMRGMMNFSGDLGRSLNRMQMELVAGRVSAINECFY